MGKNSLELIRLWYSMYLFTLSLKQVNMCLTEAWWGSCGGPWWHQLSSEYPLWERRARGLVCNHNTYSVIHVIQPTAQYSHINWKITLNLTSYLFSLRSQDSVCRCTDAHGQTVSSSSPAAQLQTPKKSWEDAGWKCGSRRHEHRKYRNIARWERQQQQQVEQTLVASFTGRWIWRIISRIQNNRSRKRHIQMRI